MRDQEYEKQYQEDQRNLEVKFHELREYVLAQKPFMQSTAPDIDICQLFCRYLLTDSKNPEVRQMLKECFRGIFEERIKDPKFIHESLYALKKNISAKIWVIER